MASRPSRLQGTLWRREKGIFTSSWTRHWFNLENDKLCHYKDVGQLEYSGFLVVSTAGATVQPTGEVVQQSGSEELHCFQITTVQKNGKPQSVILAADSKEEMWRWVNGLVKWIAHFQSERKKTESSYAASGDFQPHVHPRHVFGTNTAKSLKDSGGTQSMPAMGHRSTSSEPDNGKGGGSPFPSSVLESEYVSISDCTASYKWATEDLPAVTATLSLSDSGSSTESITEGMTTLENVTRATAGESTPGEPVETTGKEDSAQTIKRLRAELAEARQHLGERDRLVYALRDALKKEEHRSDKRLQTIESLRERYFFSLCMAMKLERRLCGEEAQFNVQPLWLQLQKEDLSFHAWPEWLSSRLAELSLEAAEEAAQ